jgi:hypothetical protein
MDLSLLLAALEPSDDLIRLLDIWTYCLHLASPTPVHVIDVC